MTSVHDVMAHIRSARPNSTPMERQKLAYYAQAWHTAWEGQPLYPETIEAWQHGPVCRAAWVAEKQQAIPAIRPLPVNARRIVDAVLEFYGHYTAAQLRALTHNEGPWLQARGNTPESEMSDAEIKVSQMRRFYSRKSVLGDPVPTRPALQTEPPPIQESMQLAQRLADRWRSVLDELARR